MSHTRREFGKLALAGLPATAGLGRAESLFGAAGRPNSLIGGVQIGVIAPYSFGRESTDAEAILKALVDLGISGVELQTSAAEAFAGAPAAPQAAVGSAREGPVRARSSRPNNANSSGSGPKR